MKIPLTNRVSATCFEASQASKLTASFWKTSNSGRLSKQGLPLLSYSCLRERLEEKILPRVFLGIPERFSVFAATGFNAVLGFYLYCGFEKAVKK